MKVVLACSSKSEGRRGCAGVLLTKGLSSFAAFFLGMFGCGRKFTRVGLSFKILFRKGCLCMPAFYGRCSGTL